jgi:hypothetical protein
MPYSNLQEQREYQRAWIAERRNEWIAANGPCVVCGSRDRLEADHQDRSTKTYSPRAIWSMALDNPNRIAELAKLQVLCFSCHKAKTQVEFQKPLIHGTSNGYKKKRCRCDECRAWNAARCRTQSAAKPEIRPQADRVDFAQFGLHADNGPPREGGCLSLILGSAAAIPLKDESVQCAVTSPASYGLRSYGTPPQIWDGDPSCDHSWTDEIKLSNRERNGGHDGFVRRDRGGNPRQKRRARMLVCALRMLARRIRAGARGGLSWVGDEIAVRSVLRLPHR